MARFNKELQWLAETVGVGDLKTYGANGHLAGAIFSRLSEIVDELINRLEDGDEFRSVVDDFLVDGKTPNDDDIKVHIHKGQILAFVRVDSHDINTPNHVVLANEDNNEVSFPDWEFVKKFRFRGVP